MFAGINPVDAHRVFKEAVSTTLGEYVASVAVTLAFLYTFGAAWFSQCVVTTPG